MTHTNVVGWTLATILSLSAAPAIQPAASAQLEPIQIEIPNPGKTGLAPGRYRVGLDPVGAANKDHKPQIELISFSGTISRHRYDARITGCGGEDVGKMSWAHKIVNRPDGSIQLELVSKSAPGCRVVSAIPAAPVPGIEGSPIGTAGAPAQKAPVIEGTPIGTAGAPRKPGVRGGRTGAADREIEQVIVKARQALPRLACTNAPGNIQARLAPVQSSLKEVAGAASAAAAVQPLRRFDAARQALYKSLAGDRAFAAGAKRCADTERRCTASGSVGNGCGIDAAVCLAGVLCAAEK